MPALASLALGLSVRIPVICHHGPAPRIAYDSVYDKTSQILEFAALDIC